MSFDVFNSMNTSQQNASQPLPNQLAMDQVPFAIIRPAHDGLITHVKKFHQQVFTLFKRLHHREEWSVDWHRFGYLPTGCRATWWRYHH